MINVVLVSSDQLLRAGLAALLEKNHGVRVIRMVDNVDQAIKSGDSPIDVIVAEAASLQGVNVAFLLGAKAYGGFSVLALGADGKKGDLEFATSLPRGITAEDFVAAVKDAGQNGANRPYEGRAEGMRMGLTSREYEIAQLVAHGLSNAGIAETMQIKLQTVKNSVTTIMRKLSLDNRTQLALRVLEEEGRAVPLTALVAK